MAFDPTTGNEGTLLYSGSAETFQMTNFASFEHGRTYYLSLRAINIDGIASAFQVFEYQTAPLKLLSSNFDRVQNQVTLGWSSLPGKSYRVEKSINLTDWTTLATPPPSPQSTHTAATGEWTMTRVVDAPGLGTEPRAFTRITVVP